MWAHEMLARVLYSSAGCGDRIGGVKEHDPPLPQTTVP